MLATLSEPLNEPAFFCTILLCAVDALYLLLNKLKDKLMQVDNSIHYKLWNSTFYTFSSSDY